MTIDRGVALIQNKYLLNEGFSGATLGREQDRDTTLERQTPLIRLLLGEPGYEGI